MEGTVDQVGRPIDGSPYVLFPDEADHINVACYFPAHSYVSKSLEGERVTISGVCKGVTETGLVALQDCQVVERHQDQMKSTRLFPSDIRQR